MADSKQLGAEYSKDNTQFRVASEHAQKMELCLFSPDEKEEKRIPMERQGDVWQGLYSCRQCGLYRRAGFGGPRLCPHRRRAGHAGGAGGSIPDRGGKMHGGNALSAAGLRGKIG